MRRSIEKIYCDCCGKEIDENALKYYPDNPYEKLDLKLAIVVDSSINNYIVKDAIDTVSINDICDDCMKKICDFTDELMTINEKECIADVVTKLYN